MHIHGEYCIDWVALLVTAFEGRPYWWLNPDLFQNGEVLSLQENTNY